MKPFFMLDKGLFQAPEAPLKVSEDDFGVGTVEDVTGEYQKERHQTVDTEVCYISYNLSLYTNHHSQRRHGLRIPIFKRVRLCACGLVT